MILRYARLSAPLYALVLLGYAVARVPRWRASWTTWASNFVFAVALPALLFHMMSDLSSLPPVDARLLLAFFGGCLIVFVVGRVVAARVFALDGVAQSVFALGGIFSNNVLLGLPLAKLAIGPAAVPSVALVLVFNSLTLWTLVSVSVEWARHGAFTLAGIGKTARGVAQNPIVASIVGGTLFGLTGSKLPWLIDRPLGAARPHRRARRAARARARAGSVRHPPRLAAELAICALKLVLLPLVVWGLAAALGLPALETKVIVLLSSMATGANVYLMSIQFKSLQGPVASSLVLSTALAALTTPFCSLFWTPLANCTLSRYNGRQEASSAPLSAASVRILGRAIENECDSARTQAAPHSSYAKGRCVSAMRTIMESYRMGFKGYFGLCLVLALAGCAAKSKTR